MDEAVKYLLVYATGALGVWKGAALGIALNLQSFYTGLLTSLGSISSIMLLYFAGDSIKQWIMNKYGKKRMEKQKNQFIKLANQYGIWVLGLISPGLLGPIAPLFFGLLLFKDTKKFLIYLLAGIVLWSFILAYLFTPVFDFFSGLI